MHDITQDQIDTIRQHALTACGAEVAAALPDVHPVDRKRLLELAAYSMMAANAHFQTATLAGDDYQPSTSGGDLMQRLAQIVLQQARERRRAHAIH